MKSLESAHIKDLVVVLRWIENPRDALAAFSVLQLMEYEWLNTAGYRGLFPSTTPACGCGESNGISYDSG